MGTRGDVVGVALTLAFVLSFSSVVRAEDVSVYRGFRLGMTVPEVATEARMPPASAKVVFERPLLIQELEWRPPAAASTTGDAPTQDSVAQVLFGFCSGKLYRIVVSYEAERTEGLTETDLIEALSIAYGPARTPIARIITSPAAETYSEPVSVVARWEDASASVNLFRGSYQPAFGLVIFSKTVAPLARAAIEQSLRLAELDAPRRAIAEQKARDDSEQVAHAKARVANKAAFRF